MPKGSETQDKYISYAQPWATATPFVPVTVQGETRAMTGMLLQAMAAYGLEELKPVVLNDVITLKNTRDEQSARIVEQLFECVTFDLMTILNPGDLYNQINALYTSRLGAQDVTSVFASRKESAYTALESTLNEYREREKDFQ